MTKQFPDEGWDYDSVGEIPVYCDSTFPMWTDNKENFISLIDALPKLEKQIEFTALGEYCPDHESFNYCHFIFKNSTMTFQEYHLNDCIVANGKLYQLEKRFYFDTLKNFLDKKAYHKQKFDKDLTQTDRSEINLLYNAGLTEHIGNGYKVKSKEEYDVIWKTSWYLLKN